MSLWCLPFRSGAGATRGYEGTDAVFGFRPDAASFPEPLDKPSIIRRQNPKAVLANLFGLEETLNFCKEFSLHGTPIYTLLRAMQYAL